MAMGEHGKDGAGIWGWLQLSERNNISLFHLHYEDEKTGARRLSFSYSGLKSWPDGFGQTRNETPELRIKSGGGGGDDDDDDERRQQQGAAAGPEVSTSNAGSSEERREEKEESDGRRRGQMAAWGSPRKESATEREKRWKINVNKWAMIKRQKHTASKMPRGQGGAASETAGTGRTPVTIAAAYSVLGATTCKLHATRREYSGSWLVARGRGSWLVARGLSLIAHRTPRPPPAEASYALALNLAHWVESGSTAQLVNVGTLS
ncbi:uncharacterized protein MAM_00059 [Metarhizium album ARSEF 1941]|uniref:Uncharacterized protein n=1 Tax=Metarhizium album (strain ARSEF 1941) TaxID=1081103 RepID=A0A0B2X5L6_METAS|nr:uncharacterized protein MAM_00059 [Metarhizium album ARSEF 1941]KHO01058.1 hypothetical protein MAM_00059 [Metarhizium album ARSEF 1941]